jgi:hypothetical protein
MNWEKLLENLIPAIGEAGVKMLADKLLDLSADATEPWKKSILSLVANAVEKHGALGIKMAYDAIESLVKDKPPKIDWADLEVASDLLAHLQNAEADRKSAASDFFTKLTTDLGAILGALIKGLVSAV